MTTFFKKTRINLISIFVIAILLSNCTSQEYDLSKGVNTDISLGGDSLSFPIAKTNKILLSSIIDNKSIDILKKSSTGGYLLQMKDSTGISINTLNPVSFSIAPISIAPINTNFATINIPSFQINPINISSNLPFPTIDFSTFNLPEINSVTTKAIVIPAPSSGVKKQLKTIGANNSRSVTSDFSTGLITYQNSKIISQSFSYTYPTELKKINSIFLKNNTVTLTFDKSAINNLGFNSQNDTIKNFQIDFPAEYILSSPVGQGTRIAGNSFIIENAVLSSTQGVYIATFKIDKLDMSNYTPQSIGSLNYSKDINYSINYSFVGHSSNTDLFNRNVNIIVSLTAKPAIDDMDILTNDFSVVVPNGSNTISQNIQLPVEVSKVNSLTFEDGASLQLNIADPGITPFSFNAGNCIIQLPQKFIFKPFTGLNTSTNVLTLPYDQLFGIKNIGISGMNINQSVPAGSSSITLNDNLSYNILGLKVGSQAIKVNTINGMTDKKINVVGTISNLTIKNSSIETNSTSISIPDQSTNIDITQFVSLDVKKIYSFTLITPSILEFKLNISNLPAAFDSIFFRNYTIQFPSFLKFKADAELNAQNQLVLNKGFKVQNGFKKTLIIQSVDFGTNGIALALGTFNLHEAITMKGSAYLKGANINTSDISNIIVTPAVTIGNMSIAQIVGQISPIIQPVTQNITLNLPNFLSNGNNVLDIVNPVLTLEIGNTLGIPVDLDLTLTPKRNGAPIVDGIITTKVSVAAAAILGQTTWSRYWISNSCKGYSAGFDTINAAVQKLLRYVPDQVEIKANPTVTGTRQTVDLSSSKSELNLKYTVNVPLSFGKDFVISYNDSISDLQKQLADILKLTHQVDIVAFVENSIPLELSFAVTPLNSLKANIAGITVASPDKIKPGNVDGTSQISKITIGLRETTSGSLDQLDKLALKISAKNNSTVAGIQLNENQYIRLELRIRIPKGINITK